MVEGNLLGHNIGRNGAKCSAEKTRAILKFPALKERLHIQQFLGLHKFSQKLSSSRICSLCQAPRGVCQRGKAFPDDGLGPGTETTTDPAAWATSDCASQTWPWGRGRGAEEVCQCRRLGSDRKSQGVARLGADRGGMLEAACVHPDQDRDGRSAREGSRWEKCSPILRKGIYKGSTQLVDPLDHGRAR